MRLPLPTADVLSLEEVITKCQVTREVVSGWNQKGLKVYGDGKRIEIKSSELVEFLYQNGEKKALEQLYNLDKADITLDELLESTVRIQDTIGIHRQFEESYSNAKAKCEDIDGKLKALEKKLGLTSPDTASMRFVSLKELYGKYGALNRTAIANLCGVDKKTIGRWEKTGLKMETKNGQQETSLENLVSFLQLVEKKAKYQERIVSSNMGEMVESLEKRLTIVHKHLKDKVHNTKAGEMEVYQEIYDALKPFRIDALDRKSKTQLEVQTIEHIAKIVRKEISLPSELEISEVDIGDALLKRLKILFPSGKDKAMRLGLKKRRNYLLNLSAKLRLDLEAKANPSISDDINSFYSELAKENNWNLIRINLSETGLTPEFVRDEILSAKPVSMTYIFTHFIPRERLSPVLWLRTYNLLQFVDARQEMKKSRRPNKIKGIRGSSLLQDVFEEGKISIADAELYAASLFLYGKIWTGETIIDRKDRIAGVRALLEGIGKDAFDKRMRCIKDADYHEVIDKMLNQYIKEVPENEGGDDEAPPDEKKTDDALHAEKVEDDTHEEIEEMMRPKSVESFVEPLDEDGNSKKYALADNLYSKDNYTDYEDERESVINLFQTIERKGFPIEDGRSYLKGKFDELTQEGNKKGIKGLIDGVENIIVNTQDEDIKKAMRQELRKISIVRPQLNEDKSLTRGN